MQEFTATITSKGQVTIPAAVRALLGLQRNQKISFVVDPDGEVTLRVPKYPTVASLRGAAGKLKRKLDWDKVREIAREDALE